MLHQAEALPNNYPGGPPAHADAAVQASLGIARHYIAEGNTTAALQVCCWRALYPLAIVHEC